MGTAALIAPPRASSAPRPSGGRGRSARRPASEPPGFGQMVEEILPLIDVVAVAGPPVVVVAGPLALLGLMLFPPFAFAVTLVVALGVAAVLLALAGALLATPYLLVRRLRTQE